MLEETRRDAPDPGSSKRAAEPATIVLFGASGDLTHRKLVPSLFRLARAGYLSESTAIVGTARREKTDAAFREELVNAIERDSPGTTAQDDWRRFSERIFWHTSDFDSPEGYSGLARRLEAIERERGLAGNRLFYLATAPAYFPVIVGRLGSSGLAKPRPGSRTWVRVIVEKPFGRDLESARELNRHLLSVLDEGQIFRIDHYLGKETVQNLLVFRFSNEIFEPLWNEKYISHVQITVAETLGVEGRGGYYDEAGVLRDMVQNHLLQVLSLVAMEPPVSMEADAVRNEKVKVLQALRRVTTEDFPEHVILGQYAAGQIGGTREPGYAEEKGVPPGTRTPTFAALRCEIDSWRWAGVPFLLRSGKRLPKRVTEICIQFRRPPLRLFDSARSCNVVTNALVINIQPDEGISLRFGAKLPGPDIQVQQVKMDFRYGTSFGAPTSEAYERLLLDAMGGDSTLFIRRDEVEAAWAWISGIQGMWDEYGVLPYPYAVGSWGPREADRLFTGVEGAWRKP